MRPPAIRRPRSVVAKVEWHQNELYPCVGFIVTDITRPTERVVALHDPRRTCEQWIKEGKGSDQVGVAVVLPTRAAWSFMRSLTASARSITDDVLVQTTIVHLDDGKTMLQRPNAPSSTVPVSCGNQGSRTPLSVRPKCFTILSDSRSTSRIYVLRNLHVKGWEGRCNDHKQTGPGRAWRAASCWLR
jgi:hypothetical protein